MKLRWFEKERTALNSVKYIALGVATVLAVTPDTAGFGLAKPVLVVVGFIVGVAISLMEERKEQSVEQAKQAEATAEQERLNEEQRRLHRQLVRLLNPLGNLSTLQVTFSVEWVDELGFKDWHTVGSHHGLTLGITDSDMDMLAALNLSYIARDTSADAMLLQEAIDNLCFAIDMKRVGRVHSELSVLVRSPFTMVNLGHTPNGKHLGGHCGCRASSICAESHAGY